jgi:hypothetical protein
MAFKPTELSFMKLHFRQMSSKGINETLTKREFYQ